MISGIVVEYHLVDAAMRPINGGEREMKRWHGLPHATTRCRHFNFTFVAPPKTTRLLKEKENYWSTTSRSDAYAGASGTKNWNCVPKQQRKSQTTITTS